MTKLNNEARLILSGIAVATVVTGAVVIGCGAKNQVADQGLGSSGSVKLVDDSAPPPSAPRVTNNGAMAGTLTSTTPAAPWVAVDIVPKNGSVSSGKGVGQFDFGEIRQVDKGPVEHTFTLRNGNSTAVTIDRIQPSCGCTTAVIAGGTKSAVGGKTVIAAGGSVDVHVSIDRTHLIPGHNVKTVWVYIVDQAQPASTLEMSGTEDAAATLAPTALDFGTIDAGQGKSLEMTLTYDPHYAGGDKLEPRLQPSTDNVTLTLEKSDRNTKTYRVQLSPHATLGSTQEMVVVVPPTPGPPITAYASITAIVRGEVTAEPMSVAFGAVAANTAAVQTVTLKTSKPGVWQGMSVAPSSPYVAAKLIASGSTSASDTGPAPAADAMSAMLQVTLSPKTPHGALESHITLTTADGQQLVIPVWVFVS